MKKKIVLAAAAVLLAVSGLLYAYSLNSNTAPADVGVATPVPEKCAKGSECCSGTAKTTASTKEAVKGCCEPAKN